MLHLNGFDKNIKKRLFIAFDLAKLLKSQEKAIAKKQEMLCRKIFSAHGIHLPFLCEYSLHIPIASGHQNNIRRARLSITPRTPAPLPSRPSGTSKACKI